MKADITKDTMSSGLVKFIQEELLAENVSFDFQTPLSDVGLDSFSLIEIILFIERQYGIAVPDDALTKENIFSVETLVQCSFERPE